MFPRIIDVSHLLHLPKTALAFVEVISLSQEIQYPLTNHPFFIHITTATADLSSGGIRTPRICIPALPANVVKSSCMSI